MYRNASEFTTPASDIRIDQLPKLPSMKNAVVRNRIAKGRPSKDVGRVMRLLGNPGEAHGHSETVCDPCMPTRIWIAVRENRGQGER